MNKIDYNKVNNPKVNKLIQLPRKPYTPEHVGEALKVISDHIGLNAYITVLIKCTTLELSVARF